MTLIYYLVAEPAPKPQPTQAAWPGTAAAAPTSTLGSGTSMGSRVERQPLGRARLPPLAYRHA